MEITYVMQQFVNGIITGSMYCLMAVGLSLIWSILNVLNFTHGTFYMIGAYIAFALSSALKIDIISTLLLTSIITFFIGIVVERITIHPLLKYQGKQEWEIGTVITTLGATIFLQYLILLIFGSEYRSIQTFRKGIIQVFGCTVNSQMGMNFIIGVIIITAVLLFIRFTKFGLAMQAVSQNKEGASILGINDKKLFTITFAISVTLSAAAGILLSPIYNIYPFMGWVAFFKAFIAVVIGGLGSIGGAIVAALLLGISESLLVIVMPSGWVDVFIFLIVIILLVIKPRGLLGKRAS